jgi:hypothetical protein
VSGVIKGPAWFVADFESHAKKHGVALSPSVHKLVLHMEKSAERLNHWMSSGVALGVLLAEVPALQKVLLKHELDPVEAKQIVDRHLAASVHGDLDYHAVDEDLYSSDNIYGERSLIGGAAITRARLLGLQEVQPSDLVAAVLDAYDASSPPMDNSDWRDRRLHVPYNTLAHVISEYERTLWLSFEVIRREMSLILPAALRRERINQAPAHVRSGLISLFADYPHYESNCFLIMPFGSAAPFKDVHNAIKSALSDEGFNVLRADDRIYSENLLTNVEIFMHGSKFAVAVLERLESERHNANVTLETGYMLGMGKEVCLLKEQTVSSMPADLQGRLYVEFDAFRIEETVASNLKRWLRERRLR